MYGVSPQELCTSVLLCSRAGRCADELKCESLYVGKVRAHKGFVRCEPTRALCFCAGRYTDELMGGSPYSKSKDQPGKLAHPARGQLNKKNEFLLVLVHV